MRKITRFLCRILYRIVVDVVIFLHLEGEVCIFARKFLLDYGDIRPSIRTVKGKDLIGVEIGVDCGDGAQFILKTLDVKKLFLVDPYAEYEEFKGNTGWANVTQQDFDGRFRDAKEKLEKFRDKTEFIRKRSEDAARDIPDGLDFVYIDGNHEYKFAKHDMELYYPKLKRGGILCGDNFESVFPGVARAVLEFTDEYGLKINGARSETSFEWWVVKR